MIVIYLFFFKRNACVLGDWHHVVFGHVDPQSHHVYRYDLSMVGFCFSAAPAPFPAVLCCVLAPADFCGNRIFLQTSGRFCHWLLYLRPPAATLPSWSSNSWSSCWRRWAAMKPSWGGRESISWRSARGRAAAAASACHMSPLHGKKNDKEIKPDHWICINLYILQLWLTYFFRLLALS